MPPALEAVFTFLFKYPSRAFEQGDVALQPVFPVVALGIAAAVLLLVVVVRSARVAIPGSRLPVALAVLRVLALMIVVGCLMRPVLMLSRAVPQRNVLAVLLDDSRSMRIKDVRGGARLAAVQGVFGDSASLVEQLGARFTLRFYRFASGVTPVRSASALTGSGTRTDLAGSLDAARQELADVPLAGMVIVTDGADNAAGDIEGPLLSLRARDVPVYTVGVGEERFTRDVAVDRIALPVSTLEGGGAVAEASISVRGLAGTTVNITAEADGRVVATEKVRLGDDRETMRIPLALPPLAPGLHDILVRVAALPGETILENNEARATLRIRPGREKVLYLEGEPRPELAFLRRAVRGDTAVQLVALLRSAEQKYLRLGVDDSLELRDGFPTRRDDLFRYRAIVLGSVEAAFFSVDQLRMLADFVDRRGGGLLVLGGRNALAEGGFAGTPVAGVLPVIIAGAAGSELEAVEVTARPTGAGLAALACSLLRRGPATPDAGTRWVRSRSSIASVHSSPVRRCFSRPDRWAGGGERSLLATQRYGRGTATVFATQDSWRWQMDADTPIDDATHATLWRQLLRWSLDGVPERVDVSTVPERVAPGESIALRARVVDAEYLDVAGASVMAKSHHPSANRSWCPSTGRSATTDCTRVASRRQTPESTG